MSILVTGKNGQIAKDIRDYFGDKFANKEIFYLGHDDLDLTDDLEVNNFFKNNKIDYVLHTAIKGGRRTRKDTCEDFYYNIIMFNNIFSHIKKVKLFINFDSMASFDRELPIDNIKEEELYHRYPKDFYGLSKNLISRIGACENFINLRIFSCFSKNEPNDRMIKGSILKCLKNDDIIIYQNRKMDFTYSDDVMKVVELLLLNNKNIEKFKYRDYNLCYTEKFTLLDIAEYISDISNHKGGIVVQDQNVGLPRTGDNGRLAELGIEFKGLKRSIDELFNKLRNSDESDLFNY